MVSGILRGLETFALLRAWDDPDLYWYALMSFINWVCNVIMPLYGVLHVGAGILQYSGIGYRMYGGGDWMRHFLIAEEDPSVVRHAEIDHRGVRRDSRRRRI